MGCLEDTVGLLALLGTLLKPDVREDGTAVFHQHIAERPGSNDSPDAAFDKTSSGITALDSQSADTLHHAAEETDTVLLLPASHSQERISASLTSEAEQVRLRVIEHDLTPFALDVEVVDHRLQVTHRVGTGSLPGADFTLLRNQLIDDIRAYADLFSQVDNLFFSDVGRVETTASLLGFLDLLFDEGTQRAEDILGIVDGLWAHHI